MFVRMAPSDRLSNSDQPLVHFYGQTYLDSVKAERDISSMGPDISTAEIMDDSVKVGDATISFHRQVPSLP